MAKEVLFIKVKDTPNTKNLREKLQKNLKNQNKNLTRDIYNEERNYINKYFGNEAKNILLVVLFYDDNGIIDITIGECNLNLENEKIEYNLKKQITSKLVIDNFQSIIELDLKSDFKKENKHSFILILRNENLYDQIKIHLPLKQNENKEIKNLKAIDKEKNLNKLATKNEHCIRAIDERKNSDNNIENQNRSEFQKDRERITNSKSFRRLVDKAQIFSSSKGDHYRTRMTHTLEVNQIAKGISIELDLNIDLTEAIALAHDLGHTPFGHQGERTLDNILKCEKGFEVIKGIGEDVKSDFKIYARNFFGGFKHNFQSLRVLTKLEDKYIDFDGLNISYQVLEGAFKHTKNKSKNCVYCDKKENCNQKCYSMGEFLDFKNYKEDLLNSNNRKFCSHLEGQVVEIADEIAQRSHDIDDAISSNMLTIDEFLEFLQVPLAENLKEKINKEINLIEKSTKLITDKNELKKQRIISEIITYFIKDVVDNSRENMKKINEYKDLYNQKYKTINF